MSKLIFSNFSESYLIAIGFILFTATFLGVLCWTLFVQKKSFYVTQSQLPLIQGDYDGRE
jgi:hypothetical protein